MCLKKQCKSQKFLILAYKKQELSELSVMIGRLLVWQKFISKDLIPDKKQHTAEYMLIDDVDYKMYSKLFENCPELKEIFAVEQDRIKFNETLSTEEKEEIRQFINENYTVTIRKTRRLK